MTRRGERPLDPSVSGQPDARPDVIARHAAAAFPPAEAVERDGWLLRATPGLPRGRLNSALPLAPRPPLASALAFYAQRGLAAQVQATSTHPELGAQLDALGWGARWPTSVLVRDLARRPVPAADAVLLDAPTPRWLAAWARAEGREEADVEAHRALVLSRLPQPTTFALAGADAAVGIGVAHGTGGLAGLFCVAVDPARRRAGLGTRLVQALLGWAAGHGATTAYLEVERRNAPAQALYARLGFSEAYGYVHRLAPPAGPPRADRAARADSSH